MTRTTNAAGSRPVIVIATFLVVSAAASPLFGLLQDGTGLDPTVLVLAQFSTAVGALVVYAIWRRRLPYPPVTGRGLVGPLAVAVGLSLAVVALLVILTWAERRPWQPLDTATLPIPLGVILVAQFVGAAGEEVGWRGLVQPVLETRVRPLAAGAITGVFFGVGHFYMYAAGFAGYAVFVLSTTGLSIAAAAVTTGRDPWVRVLTGTVLHWLVNVGILIGFANADASLLWITDTAVAMGALGLACVPVLTRRGRAGAIGGARHETASA